MSRINGTASMTSADAPAAGTAETGTNGAGDYLRELEDTAPLDVVDRPRPDGDQGEDPRAQVRQLATRVEVARDYVSLQGERALVEQMTPAEIEEARRVQQLQRETDRTFDRWEIGRSLRTRKARARREGLRHWLDDRAGRSDRQAAASDRRWHVKAQRDRKRATSIDARIATQVRSSTRWSNLLIALMVVGLAYTGLTVQNNFVPSGDTADPRWWLALGLEAMCSVALMALMRFDGRAALAGVQRTTRQTASGWTVKAVLLLASLAAAAGPSILAGDLLGIVSTAWAPVLVGGVLLIHDRISRGDSEILAQLYRSAEREGLRDLAVIAEFAVQQGLIPPSQDNKPGETAPSASKLASYFRISKESARELRDVVNARTADVTA